MVNITVLGRNYSTTIGTVRSLGQCGYSPDVIYVSIRKDAAIVKSCRYVRSFTEIKKQDEDRIIKALLSAKNKNDVHFLLPTDDFTAKVVDRHRIKLRNFYRLPYFNNADPAKQLEYYMDKNVQMELAGQSGLKTVKSWTIDLTTDTCFLPDDIVFPCFCKPLKSADGGKRDIGMCSSLDELKQKAAYLKKKGRESFMVQELLDIQCEYVIEGVCADQKVLIPGVIKKTLIATFNKGVTLSGTLYSNGILPKDVLDHVNDFLKSLHYIGIFDLEFIQTKQGIFFGEINLRNGGPCYIYTLCGVNLPSIAIRAIANEEIELPEKIDYGKSFISEKVLWEDYLHGQISKREFLNYKKKADYSLTYDKNDVLPGIMFNWINCKRKVKNIIKYMIGRK